MSTFVLLRPWWLLALLPLVILLWLLHRTPNTAGGWDAVIDPELRDHVLESEQTSNSRAWLLWLALAWVLTLIVLVGPSWEQQEMPVYKGQDAQVIVLDLSQSMDAEDIKPSRLTRARFKLTDLLQRSYGMQVGLIVFSEVPYIVSPLTDDIATLDSFLPALTTSVVPVQGGQIAAALTLAQTLLEQASAPRANVTLVTDSSADAAALDAAAALSAAGYRLSVLGVGSTQGAPIALQDGTYLEDANGKIVLPVLDADALNALAQRGKGVYQTVTDDDSDLDALSADHKLSGNVTQASADDRQTTNWIEHAPWLLLPLLALGMQLFRRGVL